MTVNDIEIMRFFECDDVPFCKSNYPRKTFRILADGGLRDITHSSRAAHVGTYLYSRTISRKKAISLATILDIRRYCEYDGVPFAVFTYKTYRIFADGSLLNIQPLSKSHVSKSDASRTISREEAISLAAAMERIGS